MNDAVSVAPATRADLAEALALIESAYRGDSARWGWTHEADLLGGQRTDATLLGELLDDPAQTLLLAREGGRPLGCAQVNDEGAGRAYLGLLSVDPARQAGGLGKRLVAAAEAHARETLGARVMAMTVIKQRGELIAWYERQGYARTGEERPFPLDDARFGLPKRRDLAFAVLEKRL